jgi:hypothetical protein
MFGEVWQRPLRHLLRRGQPRCRRLRRRAGFSAAHRLAESTGAGSDRCRADRASEAGPGWTVADRFDRHCGSVPEAQMVVLRARWGRPRRPRSRRPDRGPCPSVRCDWETSVSVVRQGRSATPTRSCESSCRSTCSEGRPTRSGATQTTGRHLDCRRCRPGLDQGPHHHWICHATSEDLRAGLGRTT